MLTHAPWIDKRAPSPMCGSAILLPSNQVEFLVRAHWPACPVTLYLSHGAFIHTCAHTHARWLASVHGLILVDKASETHAAEPREDEAAVLPVGPCGDAG